MFAAGDHEGEGWHIYRGQVPHEHASAGHCGPLPSITSLPCLSGLCACLSFLSICLPACPSIVPSVCLTVPFLQANLSVCMSV